MQTAQSVWDTLHALPRLGWVSEPTPVTAMPVEAAAQGLGGLFIKRDDHTSPLFGGTKTRKLDYLLAAEPFASAECWVSSGAIGSGHLVSLAAAAYRLDRKLQAHLFWELPTPEALDNLAYTAHHATSLHYQGSRVGMFVRKPRLVFGGTNGSTSIIPPGATLPVAGLGLVRAGLELARQIDGGELPAPDDVFVCLGTGGTLAGLLVGLGLAGLTPCVHAVAAVEQWLSPNRRIASLTAGINDLLRLHGVTPPRLPKLVIHREHLGAAYGYPTGASVMAVERFRGRLPLEPVYTGKTMAALLEHAPELQNRQVLFWQTARRNALPRPVGWEGRLPEGLRRRLRDDINPGRRRLLIGAGATAVALTAGVRLTGYPDWQGDVLRAWEAAVLIATSEALFAGLSGPTPHEIAVNADRYLRGLPQSTLLELHGLFALMEHGTGLSCRLSRLTHLPSSERLAHLRWLSSTGRMPALAVRSLRDLCLLGFWQDNRTWELLGYGGPWLKEPQSAPQYERLAAAHGQVPQ
jgi:D-cysteine desulfhydrase